MAEYTVINEHSGMKDGKLHRFKKGETRVAEPDEVKGHVHFKNLVLKVHEPKAKDKD